MKNVNRLIAMRKIALAFISILLIVSFTACGVVNQDEDTLKNPSNTNTEQKQLTIKDCLEETNRLMIQYTEGDSIEYSQYNLDSVNTKYKDSNGEIRVKYYYDLNLCNTNKKTKEKFASTPLGKAIYICDENGVVKGCITTTNYRKITGPSEVANVIYEAHLAYAVILPIVNYNSVKYTVKDFIQKLSDTHESELSFKSTINGHDIYYSTIFNSENVCCTELKIDPMVNETIISDNNTEQNNITANNSAETQPQNNNMQSYNSNKSNNTNDYVYHYESSGSSGNENSGNYNNAGTPKTDPCANGHNWVAMTQTVHHNEQGHYERVETKSASNVFKCPMCNKKFESLNDYYTHFDSNYPDLYWMRESYTVEIVPAEYDNKYVVDKAAYDEVVTTGYKCSVCGTYK